VLVSEPRRCLVYWQVEERFYSSRFLRVYFYEQVGGDKQRTLWDRYLNLEPNSSRSTRSRNATGFQTSHRDTRRSLSHTDIHSRPDLRDILPNEEVRRIRTSSSSSSSSRPHHNSSSNLRGNSVDIHPATIHRNRAPIRRILINKVNSRIRDNGSRHSRLNGDSSLVSNKALRAKIQARPKARLRNKKATRNAIPGCTQD